MFHEFNQISFRVKSVQYAVFTDNGNKIFFCYTLCYFGWRRE